MANAIRALVSKKKLRFQEDGFDLDLSYITERLIAMGYPSEGVEGVYRNNMEDVKKFFAAYHEKHFKVYNLCSERSYSPNHFGNATASFPFDDHNPAPFETLVTFCEDADRYLDEDMENVIAVHCKAGKGRTGLVLCCYLQFNQSCSGPDDALDFYARARTMNNRGVTIPSQIRWVYYFGEYLRNYRRARVPRPFNFKGTPIIITGISLHGYAVFDITKYCKPYFKCTRMDKTCFYNYKEMCKSRNLSLLKWEKGDPPLDLKCEVTAQGNFNTTFYSVATFGKDVKMFGFWLHSSFLPINDNDQGDDNYMIEFEKWELDKAVKDTKHKIYPQDFKIVMRYKKNIDYQDSDDDYDSDDEKRRIDTKSSGGGAGLTNIARRLVSKKKLRYQKDGFDLDLSYITPNIIAMGFPSVGTEGLYRNKMEDVQRFLKFYHDGTFKVYNLCSERTYTPDHFNNSTASYPFDDHNPPTFKMLATFCEDAAKFLDDGERNVVVIHCKAGKGRTGTTIAALLQHLELEPTAAAALAYYGKMRTSNVKGVTIPSQQRYVRYYEEYWQDFVQRGRQFNFAGPPMKLVGFYLSPVINSDVGGGCDPYFKITKKDNTVLYNSKNESRVRNWSKEPYWVYQCKVEIQGDVHVQFYDYDMIGKDKRLFGFWLHTSFIVGKSVILTKDELDGAVKDKRHAVFDEQFMCQVFFAGAPDFKATAGRSSRSHTVGGAAPGQVLQAPRAPVHTKTPSGLGMIASDELHFHQNTLASISEESVSRDVGHGGTISLDFQNLVPPSSGSEIQHIRVRSYYDDSKVTGSGIITDAMASANHTRAPTAERISSGDESEDYSYSESEEDEDDYYLSASDSQFMNRRTPSKIPSAVQNVNIDSFMRHIASAQNDNDDSSDKEAPPPPPDLGSDSDKDAPPPPPDSDSDSDAEAPPPPPDSELDSDSGSDSDEDFDVPPPPPPDSDNESSEDSDDEDIAPPPPPLQLSDDDIPDDFVPCDLPPPVPPPPQAPPDL